MAGVLNEHACTDCGEAVAADERFCGSCGARVDRQGPAADGGRCPACGAPVEADEVFCGECGAGLSGRTSGFAATVTRPRRPVLVPHAPAETLATDGQTFGGPGQSFAVAALVAVVFSVALRSTTLLLGLIDTSPALGSVDWLGLVLSVVGWLVPFFFVAVALAATRTARMSMLWLMPLVSLACFAVLVGGLIIYLMTLTPGGLAWLVWVINISGMLAAFVPFGVAIAIAGNTVPPRWVPITCSVVFAVATGVAMRWMASSWIQIDLSGLTFIEGSWAAVLREYLFLTLMTFTLFGAFQLRWRVVATPSVAGATPRAQSVGPTAFAIAAATVVVLGIGAGLIAVSQSDAYAEAAGDQYANYAWADEDAYVEGYEGEGVDDSYDESSYSSDSSSYSSDSDTTTPSTQPSIRPIRPVSAVATAERSSYHLRCTGEYVTYGASRLIDGDMDTGWGAGENDGMGQAVTVRFGEQVQLDRIGLTPGFAKFGPRQDKGCASVEAFPFNRFISSVRYTFDDGTSVVQSFEQRKDLQYISVDVVTQSVTITILATDQPYGADDDTILSEAVFEGRPA